MTLKSDPSTDQTSENGTSDLETKIAPGNEGEAQDTGSNSDQGAKDTSAKSPSADEQGAKDERKTLLDAVKKAVETPKAPGNSPDPSAKTDPAEADATKAKAEDAKTADKDLPFHNHPRWQELLRERDTYRPKAEQFDKIEQFMGANSLNHNEVAEGFAIMAAIKNDPTAAWKMLEPVVVNLKKAIGEILPDDLQKRVEEGAIDETSAQELARTRNEKALADERAKRTVERANTDENKRLVTARMSEVNRWEAETQAKDPDYARKQPMVLDRIKVLMQDLKTQGVDPETLTPQEALQVAQKAYSDVSAYIKPLVPKRPAIGRVPSGNSSTSATPQPQSLRDVIAAAARAGAA